ncbi:energy transducer TonB [Flavobacterium procerum]|uniref:Energy transducer TonB n=1 Tax=Flavobacterium procerum TaxID=1455569 RepID=A0ABV6BP13_9FLAO
MNSYFLLTLTTFLFAFTAQAQSDKDSIIVNKYKIDTLNFKPFESGKLLHSIHPKKGFTQWEIDIIRDSSPKVVDRFPSVENISDTLVLAKPANIKSFNGFYRISAPTISRWYMSAKKKRKTIIIQNSKQLGRFLGNLDNEFDAYLYLFFNTPLSNPVYFAPYENAWYKKVEDGYLITAHKPSTSDAAESHPKSKIDFFNTYFIGFNKQVTKIRTKEVITHYPPQKRYLLGLIEVDSSLTYIFNGIPESQLINKHLKYKYPESSTPFARYFARNFHYSNDVLEDNIQGEVTASFTIEKDGTVSKINILKGIDERMDKEVNRVLSKMRLWTSGELSSKPIPVEIIVKIKFGIQG